MAAVPHRAPACDLADNVRGYPGTPYNGIGRLTGETRTGPSAFTASYTVDGEGNRTSQTIGANTTSFTLNDDYELTATSGGFSNSYSYNANPRQRHAGTVCEQTGRTLAGTAYTLGYDFEGQLTQITQGQNTTDFVYDALGRRYSRTAGGTTTVFYYSGNQVLLEKQGDTFTAAYTHGNALLRRNSEYPLYDGHGSERTVTNGSETVTGTINFEAFGQTAGTTGSSSSPYMYPRQRHAGTGAGAWGYRTDGDAGLMHPRQRHAGTSVGARYYDAQVGRFITTDDDLSESPFLYCEHDPTNYVDPTGNGGEQSGPGGTTYRMDLREQPEPDMHIRYRDGRETVVSVKGGWKRGFHRGRKLIPIPRILRKAFRPIVKGFIKKVPLIGVGLIGYDLYRTWRDPNSTWVDYGAALRL